ncbi:MAG: hypothetical protein AAFO07_12825, partial [Bacteroidota bacterium]
QNDKWPILPRDIFSINIPTTEEANTVTIAYRSIIVSFGMSVKQLEDDLSDWLEKMENFIKEMPNSYEAKVNVELIPYTANYRNGQLTYFWEKRSLGIDSELWTFNGDPTNLDEICEPINYENFHFTDVFREELISTIQWIGDQIGTEITLVDKLTTVRGNYDRHFARSSMFEFKLIRFGVRTSGAIAMLEGENINFEFKTDAIRKIMKQENYIELELKLDFDTTRMIRIEKKQSLVITKAS